MQVHMMLFIPLHRRPALGNFLAVDVTGEAIPASEHQMHLMPLALVERHLRLTDPKIGACPDSALGDANVLEAPAVLV